MATQLFEADHRTAFAAPRMRRYEAQTTVFNEKARMNEDGLEAIFMAHRPALLRFFTARGGGTDVDDLLQELWFKVRAAPSGPIAEPSAYLFRMADNLMLDRRRGDMRRTRRDDEWTGLTRGAVLDVSEEPSAEQILVARERLRIVDGVIDALGERTALIFRSYRIDGLNQRDIAAMTGISLSAVEKHLQKAYRALVDIRSRLDADMPAGRRLDVEGSNDVTD